MSKVGEGKGGKGEGGDHITYHGFVLIFLTALYSPNGGTGQHGKRGAK